MSTLFDFLRVKILNDLSMTCFLEEVVSCLFETCMNEGISGFLKLGYDCDSI